MTEINFELPLLYKTTKTGRIHVWRVWTQNKWLYRQDYQLKGNTKKEPSVREYRATNVGKSNARTPREQAIIEAARTWVKRLDPTTHVGKNDATGQKLEQFVLDLRSVQGETNHDIASKVVKFMSGEYRNAQHAIRKAPVKIKKVMSGGGMGIIRTVENKIKPMLAAPFQASRLDFVGGCWLQAKLDGIRGIARLQKTTLTPSGYEVALTTRSGKQFVWLLKIKQAILEFLKKFPHVILDGEVYTHSLTDEEGNEFSESKKFNLISGAARPTRGKPSEYETQLQYHVFDVVDGQTTQKERFDALKYLFDAWNTSAPSHLKNLIQRVPWYVVKSEDEIKRNYEYLLAHRWEGCIIRLNAKYQFSRSHFLLKLKPEEDSEFVILSVVDGEGTEEGCAIFECVTPGGKKFSCRPRGTFEERKKIFNRSHKYIGKSITVVYQDLGDDGIPRFPRAKALRLDL